MSDLGEELDFICDEADIGLGKKSKKKLQDNGVETFQDLMEKAQTLLDPNKGSEKDLLQVIKWAKHFKESHDGRDPIMTEGGDFTEQAFQQFKTEHQAIELTAKDMSRVFYALPEETKEKVRKNPFMLGKIQGETAHRIVESAMTQQLKKELGNFDYMKYTSFVVQKAYGCADDPTPTDPKEALVFVVGQMQSGKSAVKAVTALVSNSVRLPSIIATKGVDESKQLVKKLRKCLAGTDLVKSREIVGLSSHDMDGVKRTGKHKIAEIEKALGNKGVVVLCDTAPQFRKVTEAIRSYKAKQDIKGGESGFVFMVDEVDAIYCRTPDRRTKIEQAYDELVALKPTLSAMISATPVPMMLEVAFGDLYEDMPDPDIFNIDPRDEYCGISDMQVLEDSNGKPVYLDSKELCHANLYRSQEAEDLLIKDALQDASRNGVLVLDCTNPRVYAPGNVKEKAEYVQEWCQGEHGEPVIVMVIVGRGIEIRCPKFDENYQLVREWESIDKKKNVDEVIEDIDKEWGLHYPVFCFGFSKMTRGQSFRSSRRVPTHMILSLGTGHHVMNYVQALGRATGNGKSVLNTNGFKAVTILTTPQDYTMAGKVLRFVDEVHKSIQGGATLREALLGAKEAIPDGANFLRHTPRKISRIPEHKRLLQLAKFEKPPPELSEGEKVIKERFHNKDLHQKVLRCICEITKKGGAMGFSQTDVQEAFDDTFLDDNMEITTKNLKNVLKDFVSAAVVQKLDSGKEDKDEHWYSINCPRHLLCYLNRSLALTADEMNDGDTLEYALGLDDDCSDGRSEAGEENNRNKADDINGDECSCEEPTTPTACSLVRGMTKDEINRANRNGIEMGMADSLEQINNSGSDVDSHSEDMEDFGSAGAPATRDDDGITTPPSLAFEMKESDPFIEPSIGELVSFKYHENEYRVGVVCSSPKGGSKTQSQKARFFFGYDEENDEAISQDLDIYTTREFFDRRQFRARPELKPKCRCYDGSRGAYCTLMQISIRCGSVVVRYDGNEEMDEISPDHLVATPQNEEETETEEVTMAEAEDHDDHQTKEVPTTPESTKKCLASRSKHYDLVEACSCPSPPVMEVYPATTSTETGDDSSSSSSGGSSDDNNNNRPRTIPAAALVTPENSQGRVPQSNHRLTGRRGRLDTENLLELLHKKLRES